MPVGCLGPARLRIELPFWWANIPVEEHDWAKALFFFLQVLRKKTNCFCVFQGKLPFTPTYTPVSFQMLCTRMQINVQAQHKLTTQDRALRRSPQSQSSAFTLLSNGLCVLVGDSKCNCKSMQQKQAGPLQEGYSIPVLRLCSRSLIIWARFPTTTTSSQQTRLWLPPDWYIISLSLSIDFFPSCFPFICFIKRGTGAGAGYWGAVWVPLFLAWANLCLLSDEESWIIKPFLNVYGDICSGKWTNPSLWNCVLCKGISFKNHRWSLFHWGMHTSLY